MPKQKATLSSRRPPVKQLDEHTIQSFIDGATPEAAPEDSPGRKRQPSPKPRMTQKTYPWDDPLVSDTNIKSYLLRLPEPYLMKLRFIREKTGKSMQRVCLDAVKPAIDAEVQKITRKG